VDAVRVWDAASGNLLKVGGGPRAGSYDQLTGNLMVSGDGSRIATIRGALDSSTGQLLTSFKTKREDGGIRSVAFSPDGTRVLSGDLHGVLKLWDASTGEQIATFQEKMETEISSVAFSPDARYAASGTDNYDAQSPLMLWEAATGVLVRSFQTPEEKAPEVSSIAFSPDGSHLVSAGIDEKIRIWDVTSGELLHTLEGHTDWVWAVSFPPDGASLLSGSGDSTLKLWDAASGALIRTFTGHTDGVKSVAFSPDGQKVVSGGNDTSVRVWAARSGKLLATFFGLTSGDWFTMTPQGFFTGTRGTKEMLSVVRGLEVTAVDETLLNPDLVREALSGDPSDDV
jgi:uncharacterized protein with WD repeat